MEHESDQMPRRDFLKIASASLASMALPLKMADRQSSHFASFVPVDKQLSDPLLKSLTAKGEPQWSKGRDLRFIGMPVGGVCAGQVYLGGDGHLWLWDIFNQEKLGVVPKSVHFQGKDWDASGGANYIEPPEQIHPFEQGFSIRIGGKEWSLDHSGFSDIEFNGNYPIGRVAYHDPSLPVQVDLSAFSPFIPLNTPDSTLPVTCMRFTVTNRGEMDQPIELTGWLQNPIGLHTVSEDEAEWVNEPHSRKRSEAVVCCIHQASNPPARWPTVVFEDFQKPTYEGWEVSGKAFGEGPIEKTQLPSYQGDVGGAGDRVVNSHNARHGENIEEADRYTGRLKSKAFKIDRKYISFWICGGNHPGKTCLNLLIDDKIVRSATGSNSNRLRLEHFDVAELAGKTAQLEIVDDETGSWGNIGIGTISFTDTVEKSALNLRPDVGEMSISILRAPGATSTSIAIADRPTHNRLPGKVASVSASRTLQPGESASFEFIIAWRFPNFSLPTIGSAGRHYAFRFSSVEEILDYVEANFHRLADLTEKWVETWYDSSLPHWFLDRTMGNTATLATNTAVQFANGRFYGWEGVGCCEGTCGHVWMYAQAMARLFPDLERSVREMVDYSLAFHPESGMIEFRGEYGNGFAADAQAGYVLRALREHQCSVDDSFLRPLWPRVKLATQCLISKDQAREGILSGVQMSTLDVPLHGPSSWLTSLYLAALRAAEEMAIEMGDAEFAQECRSIFERGSESFAKVFWNGSYFIHIPKDSPHEALCYGNGCEVDQVMGQSWAYQVGLGRILEPTKTKQALAALYRNNFLPDIGPYRKRFTAGRWYALPGEGGLLMCTFPGGDRDQILGKDPTWASMYFNECMTGFEYEAAGHMIAEGLVTEGLTVMRAIHDRYSPSKRNPYNEVECSDHYARCMAVYGAYLNLCGFEYHGPKCHIGFAPKLRPEEFRAAFTAAEGWGTYHQRISDRTLHVHLEVRFGMVSVKTMSLEVPKGAQVGGVSAQGIHDVTFSQSEQMVTVEFPERVKVSGEKLLHLSLEFIGSI